MKREIVEYSADLKFRRLVKTDLAAVQAAAERDRFEISLTETSLRFNYSGRDAGNRVLEFWRAVAPVLKSADGRIRREIVWSNDEETLDFYSINNGNLQKIAPTAVVAA